MEIHNINLNINISLSSNNIDKDYIEYGSITEFCSVLIFFSFIELGKLEFFKMTI
jgi:hypothetical protein